MGDSNMRGLAEINRQLSLPPPVGLVNNVVYVIFLSAAEDILRSDGGGGGTAIRKSSVLLADILPCFFVKLISPYFVRIVPYGWMVAAAVTLSFAALSVVALVPTVGLRFLGIILCSISCGLGETAFLALTSYFDPKTVIAWSSGTGAAGIVGAVYYWFFSSVLDLSMRPILLMATVLPLLMASAYLFLLREEHCEIPVATSSPKEGTDDEDDNNNHEEDGGRDVIKIDLGMDEAVGFWARIGMIRPLIWRYILPLLLVYFAEYCINQSVYFALLYPLPETPFSHYRDHYKTYSAIYQTGVFLSRTFGRLIPVSNCWTFVALQGAMLAILSTETVYSYLGSVYPVFGLILVEGLLGGAAYVTTFCNITEQVERRNLEFSMAFTGVADSLGILLAGLTCLVYEPFLCGRNQICSRLQRAGLG